jgi:hypothetical protein
LLKAALNTKPLPNCISYSHCWLNSNTIAISVL